MGWLDGNLSDWPFDQACYEEVCESLHYIWCGCGEVECDFTWSVFVASYRVMKLVDAWEDARLVDSMVA